MCAPIYDLPDWPAFRQLVERGVLVKGTAGGRSTSYTLAGLTESR